MEVLFFATILSMAPLSVDPSQSTLDGTFSQTIYMPGALIGDYDEKTYPEGTMTRPWVWGGSGNQPIDCSIEPNFGGDFGGNFGGDFDGHFG